MSRDECNQSYCSTHEMMLGDGSVLTARVERRTGSEYRVQWDFHGTAIIGHGMSVREAILDAANQKPVEPVVIDSVLGR